MQLIINNQKTEINANTLDSIVRELNLPQSGIAIAVNQQIVPQKSWHDTLLQPNDQITIIRATRGG